MLQDCLTNNIENKEFSVSEISNQVKWLLENNFNNIKVKGEISGLKIAASGHGYFSLKDQNSVLAATCWRHNLSRINFKLEEGLEVIVTGKVTAYAGQSKYQISVDRIEPSGDGAFMKILRERKQKLEQEGLFLKEHKQKLPLLPQKIGVITSISGSVIKDIIHRISDRFPSNLIIWPVTVQGETAASEVSKAIENFNKMPNDKKPDILIIARGGGSIEDLWAFNEEIVIRSAFKSTIPIISAIGHETDYTLLDLVADMRAPTPTAAAEFAVPVLRDLKYTIENYFLRINNKLTDLLKYNEQIIKNSYLSLLKIPDQLNQHSQKLDDISFSLSKALPNFLKQKELELKYFPASRFSPKKTLNYKILEYNNLSNILNTKKENLLLSYQQKLNLKSSLLESMDYQKTLKRGYSIIKDPNNNIISSISEVKKDIDYKINMSDGEIIMHKS